MTDPQTFLTITATVLAVLGGIGGWVKVIRPRVERGRATGRAMVATLIGTEEVRDPITGELIREAQPGVGVRMANQERTTELLTVTVTKLVDQGAHQERLESRVTAVEAEIADLKAAQVERIVTRAESAQAWRAMEAAALASPDPEADPLP